MARSSVIDLTAPLLGKDQGSEVDSLGDVESQTQSSQSEEVSTVRDKPVYCKLAAEAVETFRTEYGINPIQITAEDEPVNQHPHLHAQRCWLELDALKLLDKEFPTGLWLDVGSQPRRVLRYRQSRCLVPIIQPGDTLRYAPYKNEHRVCNHPLEKWIAINRDHQEVCHVCDPLLKYDALLFVHSAYYIRPSLMLEALRNTTSQTAYVVGFEFDVTGRYPYDEGMYHSEGGNVVCRVAGNRHKYFHPRLPWEGSDHFVVGGTVVEAHLVKRLGSTLLWKLMVSTISPPPQANINWKNALLDETQVGPIPLPQSAHTDVAGLLRNDQVTLNLLSTVTLTGYRSGVLLTCGSRDLCFMAPKSIIQQVSALVSGKERNEALFRSALNKTHRLITDASLPTDNIEQVCLLITAVAFVANLQLENDIYHTIATRYGDLMDMHRRLITLKPVRAWSVMVLAALGVMFLLADVFVGAYAHSPHHVVEFVCAGVAFLLMAGSIYVYCVRYQTPQSADDWAMSVTVDREPIYVTQPIEAAPLSIPPSTNFKPIAEIRDNAKLKILPVPDKERPGSPSVAAGWVFDRLVPLVFPSTRDAELSGISNRVLRPKPEFTQQAKREYASIFQKPDYQFTSFIQVVDDSSLRNRWIQRYPENMRAQLKEAYRRLKGTRPAKKMLNSKAFIKRELAVTLTDEGFAKKAPRIISGPSDEAKVVLGPAFWEMSNQLAERWDGHQSHLCYARGRSAEYLGGLVQAFVDETYELPDDIVILCNDMEIYDSSCEDGHFEPIDRQLPEIGFRPETMEFVNNRHTTGVTANGIYYSAEEQMIDSGSPNTNLYGTIVNAATHEASFEMLQVQCLLMLVGGDDNFSLLRYRGDTAKLCDDIKATMARYGLRCTPIVTRKLSHADFYSKLFWPTKDGLVLSPKPGRLLPKLGHSIIPHGGLAEYKGKLLSLQNDVQHIPLLNSYFRLALASLDKANRELKAIKPKHEEHIVHVSTTHQRVEATDKFFMDRYGIGMAEVTRFTAMLRTINSPTAVLPCEDWLFEVFKIDSA